MRNPSDREFIDDIFQKPRKQTDISWIGNKQDTNCDN